jgi:hypothetical protein
MVRGPPGVQNTKIYFVVFRTEFLSFDSKQYSDVFRSKFANNYRRNPDYRVAVEGGRDDFICGTVDSVCRFDVTSFPWKPSANRGSL